MNDNDTDRPAEDDVDGHGYRRTVADTEADDVAGHGYRRAFPAEQGDDVAGHISGALGAQKRDDGL